MLDGKVPGRVGQNILWSSMETEAELRLVMKSSSEFHWSSSNPELFAMSAMFSLWYQRWYCTHLEYLLLLHGKALNAKYPSRVPQVFYLRPDQLLYRL